MTPAERDEVRRRASDRLADHSMATVTSNERCACDRCDEKSVAPNCATWSDQISKGLFGSRVTVWQLAKETSPQMCAATRNAPPLPLPNDFELQRSGLAVAGNGAEHYWRSMPWE